MLHGLHRCGKIDGAGVQAFAQNGCINAHPVQALQFFYAADAAAGRDL